ncbi:MULTISPECIES: acyl-CoA dehydrogenase family protein [Paenibacillus]|uniref:acyl-CoA dehydrogenase family protein n=1 Tax=Paenibacillus TaxID=44249 RepID=UPI00187B89F7|nr:MULTISPECIES: acyl-CoA dehydrogenase family protein [Paenibacillus]MBE7683770.1 acyl-CoA dehydrogenase [Paenibacillus sp. P13VS]MCM3207252.1 acyl-CoA/acyl-ACP dehydrogenase [Paenibacillus illinoisensis]
MIKPSTIAVFEQEMRKYAAELREIGLVIDREPERITEFTNLESIRTINRMMIPPEYGGEPIVTVGQERYYGLSCLERVIAIEQLSAGDAGVFLGSPGPSMSSVIISALADPQQKERYYSHFLKGTAWSFFALTEPEKGSDATEIGTRISRNGEGRLELNGQKFYIGNGHRASIGLVFAQTNRTPLGIQIALVDKSIRGFTAKPLDTMGVRGVQLSHLTFDACQLEEHDIIGRHLSPTKRGLWGALQTFHRMRPGVAALALGVAQAAFDYVREQRSFFKEREKLELEQIEMRLHALRSMIRSAAAEIDADVQKGYLASLSKIRAGALAEEATELALDLMGPGSMHEHPLLNKWYRDARAFEFMEGTTSIQKINVFQAYANGKMKHA